MHMLRASYACQLISDPIINRFMLIVKNIGNINFKVLNDIIGEVGVMLKIYIPTKYYA